VRGLLRLVVPALADLAAVTLAEDAGHDWRSELAWVCQPSEQFHARSLTSGDGHDEELIADCGLRIADFKTLIADWQRAGVQSANRKPQSATEGVVHLPLLARGRILGALTLVQGASGRRFAPGDLSLAEDLGGRAAYALDNARLYRDIQESDRHKNEFLAMLAHELRNPLAPIRNAVQVLQMPLATAQDQAWARDVIGRQVKQMVRLVDDLLDISRITRGKITLRPEPVDVHEIASAAVETTRPLVEARRHTLDVVLPPGPVLVQADSARMAQVIANLLYNAAKYTEDGGHISLTVQDEGGEAVFRVRDSGLGIPPAMLSRIFDLFAQVDRSLDRSQGGLGIGLTLVRHLIELHGGKVSAHSDGPGKGSEFVVCLPVLKDVGRRVTAEKGAEGLVHPPSLCLHPSKVLVVDDNVDAAESLALFLRMAGQEVLTAYDGPAALEAADAFLPDMVLLDIGLPRMDGYEVARRLRERPNGEQLLLVALSGYGREEDRLRSREAGFDHHYIKPVELGVFRELFDSLDRRPRAAPGVPVPDVSPRYPASLA
jgi:signal transduction histidine kinase/CheY-like chemotaxis protein